MDKNYCLFCDRNNKDEHTILIENNFCYARFDNFPVSLGHIEIVPKKHIVSFFDLNNDELNQIYSLIKQTKEILQEKYNPNGYNIGVNEGKDAGRSIDHLHIHLIPRYKNDTENPKGGVRNVILGKDDY